MEPHEVSPVTGLTIQWVGIVLVTVLSFLIKTSIRRTFLDYWTLAWVSLSVGIFALVVGSRFPGLERPLYAVYLFGGYCFGVMLIAGCRNYSSGYLANRRLLVTLVPGLILSLGLPLSTNEFELISI